MKFTLTPTLSRRERELKNGAKFRPVFFALILQFCFTTRRLLDTRAWLWRPLGLGPWLDDGGAAGDGVASGEDGFAAGLAGFGFGDDDAPFVEIEPFSGSGNQGIDAEAQGGDDRLGGDDEL